MKSEERFEEIKVLGSGMSGAVYLVRDLKYSGKLVALKTLEHSQDMSLKMEERFKNEFAIYKELQHPNIVEAFNWVTYKGLQGYTMEYVDGTMLVEEVGKKKYSLDDIESLTIQLLSAIGAVHKLNDPEKPGFNVLHRDIKLENVMVRSDGVLKLIDFGLAKRFNQNITNQGILLGTIYYLPPEYLTNKAPYEIRSDLYQCALVMWELLSDRRRSDIIEISYADIENELLQKKIKNPQLLEDERTMLLNKAIIDYLIKTDFSLPQIVLEDEEKAKKYNRILSRALNVDVRKRYKSADEFIDAFREDKVIYVDFGVKNETVKLLLVAFIIFLVVSIGLANIYYIFK